MSILLVTGAAEAKAISDFNNPFDVKCVTSIYISHFPIYGLKWNGKVAFKNGNTSGEQEFKGETIADCLTAMQAFIEALK